MRQEPTPPPQLPFQMYNLQPQDPLNEAKCEISIFRGPTALFDVCIEISAPENIYIYFCRADGAWTSKKSKNVGGSGIMLRITLPALESWEDTCAQV